jgi:hypothetical protein
MLNPSMISASPGLGKNPHREEHVFQDSGGKRTTDLKIKQLMSEHIGQMLSGRFGAVFSSEIGPRVVISLLALFYFSRLSCKERRTMIPKRKN